MAYKARGLTFDQMNEGDQFFTASRTITEADVVAFAGLSGDYNPLHTDQEWARQNTPFKARIAHGALVVSVFTGLINQLGIFEGTTIAVTEMINRFMKVVLFGDTVHVVLKVIEKKESKKPDRGTINVGYEILNQNDEVVVQGNIMVMLKRQ